LAYAAPCGFTYDWRPVFGLIVFNAEHFIDLVLIRPIYFKTTASLVDFEKKVETVIHEMIHALGFYPLLFEYFYDSNADVKTVYSQPTEVKDQVLYLKTPRVLKYAQEYFGCSDLTGVPVIIQKSYFKMEN